MRLSVINAFNDCLRLIALCFVMTAINPVDVLSAEQSKSYKEYYRLTHLATVEVARGNFEQAKSLYERAFAVTKYPMFTDLNNALYSQCSSQSPDKNKIKEYLEAIQKKGICVHSRYKKYPRIEPYLSSINETDCGMVKDSVLRKLIEEANASDQILRVFSREKLGRDYHPHLLPAIEKIDSMNYLIADSIMKLCIDRGISVENLVGLNAARSIDIIYRHNGAWERYNFEQQISYGISGIVDTRLLAFMLDDYCISANSNGEIGYRNKFSRELNCDEMFGLYGTHSLRQYADNAFVISINPNEYDRIKAMRETLFLPDVYEDAKLRAYAYYHSSEGFYYPYIIHMPYQDKADIEAFEKGIHFWSPHYIKYTSVQDFDFDRK